MQVPFMMLAAGKADPLAPAEPRLVYSGADYLLAYWLGRANGYLDDDAPGTCTRWEPGGNP